MGQDESGWTRSGLADPHGAKMSRFSTKGVGLMADTALKTSISRSTQQRSHVFAQTTSLTSLNIYMSNVDMNTYANHYNISGITHAQIPRPPSTSRFTPVMNLPSSEARYTAMFATSCGSVSLCNGMASANFLRFSGVSLTPTKDSKRPVPDSNGQMALTLIWLGPYSAARPLVA